MMTMVTTTMMVTVTTATTIVLTNPEIVIAVPMLQLLSSDTTVCFLFFSKQEIKIMNGLLVM